MSYRKIEVNGKEYKYVVGKTNIKIREVGVFPIAGNSDFFEQVCDCCGESYSDLYGTVGAGSLGVTPKHIRSLILKNAV
jgi:hypothetical protein